MKENISFFDSPKKIYEKLKTENLTPEEVSYGVKKIIKGGNSNLKLETLKHAPNLSKDDMDNLISSFRYKDGKFIIRDIFTHIDVSSLYESTENYIIKEYLKFELHYSNVGALYGDLLDKNLRLSSIKLIAERLLESDDIDLLIWCLCKEKFSGYYSLFIKKISEIGSSDDLVEVLYNSSPLKNDEIILILSYLSEKNGKEELLELIEEDIVEPEYIEYIIDLLDGMDNITVEDIELIQADELDPNSRHKLTKLYLKIGTADDILNYFKSYGCLDDEDVGLIIKGLCELKNKNVLTEISRFDDIKPYYNDIFEVLCQMEDISYRKISKIDFSLLSKENKNRYVDIVCKESDIYFIFQFVYHNKEDLAVDYINKIVEELCTRLDAEYIYEIAKLIENLSSDNISDLVNALSKTDSAKYIYKFAKNIKNISKDDISVLAKAISKTDDIEHIYLFLKNVSNIKKEDKKLLKSKILESRNMKFICLVALYIDVKLIEKLFYSKKQMYKYMVGSNLFNKKELLDASIKMFGGDIDVPFVESCVIIEIFELNCKKYKMTIKEELNKKGKNKGNK